jgi:hypothetical protein
MELTTNDWVAIAFVGLMFLWFVVMVVMWAITPSDKFFGESSRYW